MKQLFSAVEINETLDRLAAEINRDYADKQVLLVGVLKGAAVFLSHLLTRLTVDCEIDFVTISSYKHGTTSDELKFIQDLDTPVAGRNVIIVEDILDSGKTLSFLIEHLEKLGAGNIELAVLVDKVRERPFQINPPKYTGVTCDQHAFIVGFGLDHAERYRNLPGIFEIEG